MTLFKLNGINSPYRERLNDLIRINTIFKRSNKSYTKTQCTTDYIDYAVLISNSKPNTPLSLLDKSGE